MKQKASKIRLRTQNILLNRKNSNLDRDARQVTLEAHKTRVGEYLKGLSKKLIINAPKVLLIICLCALKKLSLRLIKKRGGQ